MPAPDKTATLRDAVALINDGDMLALGGCGGNNRHPMAMVSEIVRQGRRNLHIVGCGNGMDFDLLIAAGCVSAVESSAVGMGAFHPGCAFQRAVAGGGLSIVEHPETIALDRFRATSMGLPFIPRKVNLPGPHPHLIPITDPYTGENCLAVERIVPDVAVIHAHKADRFGNIQFDSDCGDEASSIDIDIARSARIAIVTVEQIVSEAAIMARPAKTVLSCTDVTCIVEAPYGAHPCSCDLRYDRDHAALAVYHAASTTLEGHASWISEWVTAPGSHEAYLQKLGSKRLMSISNKRTERS